MIKTVDQICLVQEAYFPLPAGQKLLTRTLHPHLNMSLVEQGVVVVAKIGPHQHTILVPFAGLRYLVMALEEAEGTTAAKPLPKPTKVPQKAAVTV